MNFDVIYFWSDHYHKFQIVMNRRNIEATEAATILGVGRIWHLCRLESWKFLSTFSYLFGLFVVTCNQGGSTRRGLDEYH